MKQGSDVEVSSAPIYTMRDLNQRTAEVMREINESGVPAVITRHGRFVALITPLVHEQVESVVLGAVLDATENRRQLTGESTAEGPMSSEDLARELDVQWQPRRRH